MERRHVRRPGLLGFGWVFLAVAIAPSAGLGQIQPKEKPQESWDAMYIGGTKVGYVRTQVERLIDPANQRELVRVQVDATYTLKRQNDRTTQTVRYGTVETPEGSVLRLDVRIGTGAPGGPELRTFGDVIDGKMTLTVDGGGQKTREILAWGEDVRGPHAPELSLARKPMHPGETRTEKMFIPALNKIGTLTLAAKQLEPVELGGRVKRSLLRVEATVDGPDGKPIKEMAQTLWVDDGGQVLKAYSDLFGGTTYYRTIEQAAKAPDGDFDMIAEQVVKTQRIPNPERTRAIRYLVTLKDDDPAKLFPTDRRQSIQPGTSPGSAILDVRTAGPNDGPPSDPAGEEFLRPNPLINSEDARVLRHMRRAVGNQTDPWAKAVAIQRWVHQNIRAKNFATGFETASEVAERLAGDCTEHAVLTAAMCRAAGIPSRVAIGLVYAEHLNGFGFHMWNEVFVNNRWVAIDAAFDQSDVDATHLKLNDSSLDGVSFFEVFLPVASTFKKLGLRPMEIR